MPLTAIHLITLPVLPGDRRKMLAGRVPRRQLPENIPNSQRAGICRPHGRELVVRIDTVDTAAPTFFARLAKLRFAQPGVPSMIAGSVPAAYRRSFCPGTSSSSGLRRRLLLANLRHARQRTSLKHPFFSKLLRRVRSATQIRRIAPSPADAGPRTINRQFRQNRR